MVFLISHVKESAKSATDLDLVCSQQVQVSQKKGNTGVFPHFLFVNFFSLSFFV